MRAARATPRLRAPQRAQEEARRTRAGARGAARHVPGPWSPAARARPLFSGRRGPRRRPARSARSASQGAGAKMGSCHAIPEADLGPPTPGKRPRRPQNRSRNYRLCKHLQRQPTEPFRKVPEALTSGLQRLFSPSRIDERERARRRGNGGQNPRRRAPQGCPSGSLKTRVTLETHASRGHRRRRLRPDRGSRFSIQPIKNF